MKVSAIIVLLLAAIADSAQAFRISAGGTCSAHANTQAWTDAKSAYVRAFAGAEVRGCGGSHDAEELYLYWHKRMSRPARAIANVWTSAYAHCSTYGHAFGCANAFSQAKARQSAIVTVIARAAARAINRCPYCHNKARARANINAKVVAEIFASAEIKTSAGVCVGPNSSASAEAFGDCTASVYARGIALAWAKAEIEGGCMDNHDDLGAWADVGVKTIIKADPYCACNGFVQVCVDGQCDWEKEAYGDWIGIDTLAPYPKVLASMQADCLAYAEQVY